MGSHLSPVQHILPSRYLGGGYHSINSRAFALFRTDRILDQLIDTSSRLFRIYKSPLIELDSERRLGWTVNASTGSTSASSGLRPLRS
jgi:hypothetical protein